jgi:hypothetical protein
MKSTLANLMVWSGRLLGLTTGVAALLYAVACIVWLHAPVLKVLLVTVLMALPFFGLAWLLRTLGGRLRGATRRPWFVTDPAKGAVRSFERKGGGRKNG